MPNKALFQALCCLGCKIDTRAGLKIEDLRERDLGKKYTGARNIDLVRKKRGIYWVSVPVLLLSEAESVFPRWR